MATDPVLARVEKDREALVSLLTDLCRIPAIGPTNGGDGEAKKGAVVEKVLRQTGLKVEHVDALDKRVPGGKRPNLIARVGKGPRLWFLCHMDIVPVGDRTAWKHDPFSPELADGRIYGRGTEDNGQALASVIGAYRALEESRTKPGRALGFAFVADEETGSEYGVKHLIEEGTFEKGDAFLVPDSGVAAGDEIEVAEKSVLWLRIHVEGKQGHASLPSTAVNAHRAGAYLLTLIDATLPKRFGATDPMFRPWTSTFEPTKHEANVPNVNTIPGEDTFYFDCRVLPSYKPKDVVAAVRGLADQAGKAFNVKVGVDIESEESSPPTRADAPVVVELTKAIQKARTVRAKPVGIGGGTVAAPLRRKGFPCAVWSTIDEVGHAVDEYAKVENLVGDARVFALLMAGRA